MQCYRNIIYFYIKYAYIAYSVIKPFISNVYLQYVKTICYNMFIIKPQNYLLFT